MSREPIIREFRKGVSGGTIRIHLFEPGTGTYSAIEVDKTNLILTTSGWSSAELVQESESIITATDDELLQACIDCLRRGEGGGRLLVTGIEEVTDEH